MQPVTQRRQVHGDRSLFIYSVHVHNCHARSYEYCLRFHMFVTADSVNCFKNRLDNFWKNQDIIYDYQAEILGTGNRSEVVL